MTSLPTLEQCRRRLGNSAHAASLYSLVLEAEASAGEDKAKLVAARALGYLILDPLSDRALATVLEEIASCNRALTVAHRNQSLYDLGQMYVKHLILLFKRAKGRTPNPSQHPSRPSFDRLQGQIKQHIAQSPLDRSAAKCQALLRDNFRCMVTGHVDLPSLRLYPDLEPAPTRTYQYTECCHIFPESLGNLEAKDTDRKAEYVAKVWTILDRLGYATIREELSKSKIHRLENIMTLTSNVHYLLDDLELWFEAVEGKEHYYHIKAPILKGTAPDVPSEVQFIAHHDLPLPNPEWLRIHATCARIAHMSGAAEYMDTAIRRMEEIQVLSEDGTGNSVETLMYAISSAQLVPPG